MAARHTLCILVRVCTVHVYDSTILDIAIVDPKIFVVRIRTYFSGNFESLCRFDPDHTNMCTVNPFFTTKIQSEILEAKSVTRYGMIP